MPPRQNLLGRRSDQDVGQMPHAEPFASAQYGRQGFHHRLRRVEHFGWRVAQIAAPARGALFAEVGQKLHPAAGLRLGQAQQGIQPSVIRHSPFGRSKAFVNLHPPEPHIVGTIEGQRLGRRAVATGPADFLVIGLDGFRQIGMGDPPDIRLVDTHAKGNGGHHHKTIICLKPAFDLAAVGRVHAAMIGQSRNSRLSQGACQAFGLRPGAAIDNARLTLSGRRKLQDLVAWLVFWGK